MDVYKHDGLHKISNKKIISLLFISIVLPKSGEMKKLKTSLDKLLTNLMMGLLFEDNVTQPEHNINYNEI